MNRRHVVIPGSLTHDQSMALDGHALALVLVDDAIGHTVKLVDISNGQSIEMATLEHENSVMSAVFSPNGHTLATASVGSVRLWDVVNPQNPTMMATLTGHADLVTSAVFSPDGRTLVTAGADNTIRLWDVANPRRPAEITNFSGDTSTGSPVFSPDGHTLVTAADQTIRLWGVTDPHRPTKIVALPNHAGSRPQVVFSPDGRKLAAYSTDRMIALWDVTNPYRPAETAILAGRFGPVVSAVFSQDGQTLATTHGEYSQYARFWEIGVERIEASACEDSVRPTVTQAQWDQYFPGLPFHASCR